LIHQKEVVAAIAFCIRNHGTSWRCAFRSENFVDRGDFGCGFWVFVFLRDGHGLKGFEVFALL